MAVRTPTLSGVCPCGRAISSDRLDFFKRKKLPPPTLCGLCVMEKRHGISSPTK